MATFRGRPACSCLIAWLPEYEKELLRRGLIKKNIDIYQLVGGAAASGGTHSKGGAFDIAQTAEGHIKVARWMGADATWHRKKNWDGRGGMEHTHGVLRGCPHNLPARYQIAAVDAGYNGLGAGGRARKDDGPRPLSKRTWKEGIAWAKAQAAAAKPPVVKPNPFTLRVMTWNLPGGDKLPNSAARVKVAAATILAANVDVVGLNELVGTTKGKPSPFAASLVKALGAGWTLHSPTTVFNENYILTRSTNITATKQYADKLVYAKVGKRAIPGRHVTRLLCTHRSGRVFSFNVTHLVNDDKPGAQAQAPIVAAAVTEVTKANGNCPAVLVGDMNTPDDLKGFPSSVLANVRWYAKAATDANTATYTNYSKTKPSTDLNWRIDQIYSSPAVVNGYTHLLGAPGGTFTKPRPSDHVPVIASLSYA